jgi:site-specific recombinase XerD
VKEALHAWLLGRMPAAAESAFGVDETTVDLHALRHTAASRWARRGVPLVVAQRMLGHQDVRLTASVYVHVGVEELRVAVGEAGPRRVAGAEST